MAHSAGKMVKMAPPMMPVDPQPPKMMPVAPKPSMMPSAPMPTKVIPMPPQMMPGKAPGKNGADAAMDGYIASHLNLSVKACIEGEGSICTLLQKACSLSKTYPMGLTPEEALMCKSVETVCPQQLDGFDIAASICLQKTVHVCDAVPQICQAIASEDPAQGLACAQVFQTMCAQVGK